MDPAVSSPLVAVLASDESQHVTGQVIRAVAEDIVWMQGWSEGPKISNQGHRWDATKPGEHLATDVFKTKAPGLRSSLPPRRCSRAPMKGRRREVVLPHSFGGPGRRHPDGWPRPPQPPPPVPRHST